MSRAASPRIDGRPLLLSVSTCAALLAVAIITALGCARSTAPALPASEDEALAMRQILDAGGGAASDSETVKVRAEPTGWATLAGRFRLQGTPPPRIPLNVNKDTEVCAPGGRQVLSEELVVGLSGGIRDVLVFATTELPENDPKWEHPSYAAARDAEVEFDQKDCVFLSHVFPVRTTQSVKVMNSDPIGHNTNIQPTRGANQFNQTIPAGGFTFYSPGGESRDPFPVSCSIHPWMSAFMISRENPLFAVTDAEGNFEIPNVPAGVEIEFRVWQAKANYLEDVTVNGQPANWSRGYMKITLDPDERRELDVVIDASKF